MGGKYKQFSLGSLTAVTDGTAVEVGHLEDAVVAVAISGTQTVEVQVSLDGVSWAPHPDLVGKTTSFVGLIGFPCKQVRISCTAFTDGDAVGTVAGRDVGQPG